MSPPEMPRELLALARRDYEAALILAHAENPQKDAAGFHLQQSVEKSLKAWLALREIDYPRTHDINVLLGLLEDQDEDIELYWPLLEIRGREKITYRGKTRLGPASDYRSSRTASARNRASFLARCV